MLDTHNPRAGTVFGFDFGLKRIGVAVGDYSLRIAHPLETIAIEGTQARFAHIASLISQWQPIAAVVGVPAHENERAHEFAPTCLRFARRIKGRFGLPVFWVDERYTSAIASMALNENGLHGRSQKALLDQVSAQYILQFYFNEPDYSHEIT